jgi:hypothetical protein
VADNIVQRLRSGDARCCWGDDFANCPALNECDECACAREASDEIERLRMLGDRLVNAVHFLLNEAEPTEDLAGVLAAWEGGRND